MDDIKDYEKDKIVHPDRCTVDPIKLTSMKISYFVYMLQAPPSRAAPV